MGDRHKNKENNPFQKDIQPCCDCGHCCLLHQQFSLEQRLERLERRETIHVYEANGYEPACIPGQPTGEVTLKQFGTTFPFGTLIVSNEGENAFDVQVSIEGDDDINRTVQPGVQVAISGVIRRVDAIFPPNPVRAFFHFDLYFFPPSTI